MTDYIIIVILVVALIFGIRAAVKHFRGEGGCCGGGTYKARKKKLDSVVGKKLFSVEGMSCQHCVNRVQEAVNAIDGASGTVKLKSGVVVVSMSHPIEDAVIIEAIAKAGYKASVL